MVTENTDLQNTINVGPFNIASYADTHAAKRVYTYAASFWETLGPYFAPPSDTFNIRVFETKDPLAAYSDSSVNGQAKGSSGMGGYDAPSRTGLCSLQWGLGWLGDILLRGLMADDWRKVSPQPNPWFFQSFESMLYNSFRTADGAFKGLNVVSYYRPRAQRMASEHQLISLREFLNDEKNEPSKEKQVRVPGREVLAYLHSQNQLIKFYRTFRETCSKDPSGIHAMEAVMGVPIEELDTRWRAWLMAADGEIGTSAMGTPFPVLGVLWNRTPPDGGTGVRIFETCPGSPAARGGFLKGDVILKIQGTPVHALPDLLATLKTITINSTVSVEVEREGKLLNLTCQLDRYIDG